MRTALVAFDSKQLNLILSKMLQDLGFHVSVTTAFDEAVNLCNTKKPNVVFLDWALDGQEARTFFEKITYRPCILFVSSLCLPDKIQQALDMGVREYIMKPFDNDILQSKLSLAGLL